MKAMPEILLTNELPSIGGYRLIARGIGEIKISDSLMNKIVDEFRISKQQMFFDKIKDIILFIEKQKQYVDFEMAG